MPVTFAEAAIGAQVELPTPDGTDGQASRCRPARPTASCCGVKGRGAPRLNGGGPGDLLARLRIAVPSKLSKQEREALERLQEIQRANHGDPREQLFAGGRRAIMTADDRPRYSISVAAELAGMHPQTLRMYEARGLRAAAAHPRRHPPLLRSPTSSACGGSAR